MFLVAYAFKGGNQNLGTNGFQKLPGGLIIQWGQVTVTGGLTTWTYPIPFPNTCLVVFAGQDAAAPGISVGADTSTANHKTSARIASQSSTSDAVFVFALGY